MLLHFLGSLCEAVLQQRAKLLTCINFTAQLLLALKYCRGLFRDAVSSEACICLYIPLVTGRLLRSSGQNFRTLCIIGIEIPLPGPKNYFSG